ncbi:MAG: hypothetical protein NVSMB17_09460 [Candidatus Dormibacteria bacterium]
MAYDGFISYSHSADGRLAPAIQSGLQRLARPWYRVRALSVFRDETGLSVNPHLWSSIAAALDDSRYFVLLASPEAAQSPWVNRELEHWLKSNPADRILPVLTAGTLAWSPAAGDFDPGTSSALPPVLRGRFREEPRHLDLRWAHSETELDLRHSRFRAAIAGIAAPMHGVAREAIEGEDIRRHRSAIRLAWAAVAMLALLAFGAMTTGALAFNYAQAANASARQARVAEQRALDQAQAARRAQDEATRQAGLARGAEGRATDEAQRERQAHELAATREAEAERANRLAQERAASEALARHSEAVAAARALAEKARADASATAAREQARLARESAAAAARAAQLADESAAAARASAAEARAQGLAARAGLLAAQSRAATLDPDLSMLLGAEATAISPTTAARGALLASVNRYPNLDRFLGQIEAADSTDVSPDGQLAVVRDLNSRPAIVVVDTNSGQPVPIQPPAPAVSSGSAIAFGPGNVVAYPSGSNVLVWNPSTGATTSYGLPASANTAALAFSGDGTRIAISQGGGQGPYVLDLGTRMVTALSAGNITSAASSPAQPLLGGTALPCQFSQNVVAISPGGQALAEPGFYYDPSSGTLRYLVALWDLTAPQPSTPVLALPVFDSQFGNDGVPLSLRYSADGSQLVLVMSGLDQAVMTFEAASGNLLSTVPVTSSDPRSHPPVAHPGELLTDVSSDLSVGAWLNCADSSVRVRRFSDASDTTRLPVPLLPGFTKDFNPRVRLSGDGNYVFTRSATSVQRWSVLRGSGLAATSTSLVGPAFGSGALSRDGSVAIVANPSGPDAGTILHPGTNLPAATIRVSPGLTGIQLGSLARGGSATGYLASNPDGSSGVFTVRTTDGTLAGPPAQGLFVGPPTYSDDGKAFAVPVNLGLKNFGTAVFDVSSGQLTATLDGSGFTAPAFSPDGRRLVILNDAPQELRVFDVASGGLLAVNSQVPTLSHIAFSPDGTKLVGAVNAYKQLASLLTIQTSDWTPVGNPISSPDMTAGAIAFSPNSTEVLTDGGQLVDLGTGEVLTTLVGFSGGTAAFSADGSRALNLIPGPQLLSYDLSVATNRQVACRVANRRFTAAEVARYLPGIADVACS